jgi:hypothetical protein
MDQIVVRRVTAVEVNCVCSIPSEPLAHGWSVLEATSSLDPLLYIEAVKTNSENQGPENLWKTNGKKIKRPSGPTSQGGSECIYYQLHLSHLYSGAPLHFYTFASISSPPCSGFKPSDLNPNTYIDHNMRIYQVTLALLILNDIFIFLVKNNLYNVIYIY